MKKNKLLYALVLVSIINFVLMMKFGIESKIRYIPLAINILIVLFCKEEDILPVIFYTRPNFGLYDSCGFKFLFNITIIISGLRLIVGIIKKRIKINKACLILLVLLFCYNIVLTLINDIELYYLLTYFSLFLSYIVLIIYANDEKVDFKKIYLYYAIGMIMGVICGIFIPIAKFGMQIPKSYRFSGLMRDSNGYSLELLLLIITAPIYFKLTKKNSLVLIITFSIFGFLGISKMFLICLSFIFVYKLIFKDKIKSKKVINLKNILIFIIIAIILVYINNKFDLINMFKNNYFKRFENGDLTSGRANIVNYYIEILLKDPITLFFGRSLEYYKIIGYKGYLEAHNTWLELILSYGIIGSIIYFAFIIKLIKSNNKNRILYKKELILAIIIFAFCLNALPILSGDALAILILYMFLIKNVNEKNKMEELNNVNN